MADPRFFVAVYGEPQPDKDPVESGVYTPDPRFAPFRVSAGDLMLLYCTENYGNFQKECPGLGVVLSVGPRNISYKWLPFDVTIPRRAMKEHFTEADMKRLNNIRFNAFWLFEISPESFFGAISS